MLFRVGNRPKVLSIGEKNCAPWRALLALTILGMAAPGFSFLSTPGQAQTSAAPPRIEWIDVHVHLIGGRGAWRDYEGAVSAALAVMDEAGIRKMVVMPPPQASTQQAPSDYD